MSGKQPITDATLTAIENRARKDIVLWSHDALALIDEIRRLTAANALLADELAHEQGRRAFFERKLREVEAVR